LNNIIGSLHGRTSRKSGVKVDKSVILKDRDFNDDKMMIRLNKVETVDITRIT
jgi:hypothetical protein